MTSLVDQEFRDFLIKSLATLDETTKSTLAQAMRTNGRVTAVEEKLDKHDIILALASAEKSRLTWWKDTLGRAIMPIVCAALGFTTLLALQKLEILDISVVSAEQYDSLPE